MHREQDGVYFNNSTQNTDNAIKNKCLKLVGIYSKTLEIQMYSQVSETEFDLNVNEYCAICYIVP